MVSVRNVLVGLGFAFTVYMGARGLWWTDEPRYPVVVVVALCVYLAATSLCLVMAPTTTRRAAPDGGFEPVRLPIAGSIIAVAAAVVVPSAITLGVGPDLRTAPFATWYIGGVGALMTIVMVRRRPWAAWIGTAALTAACWVYFGILNALGLGLVGSLMWVTAAQLMRFSFDRVAADTARLAGLQRAASAWQASQAGRQRERRVQVQRALAIAGPVLTRVVRSEGHLDAEGRMAARAAEARLRDELRSPRLLDDAVRAALDAARRAGVTVTLLDEGGLDEVDAASLAVIRAELADTIRGSTSSRLYIRTSPHDRIAVTVVGRQQADGALSDDDSVDLWREIPYPGATPITA